MARKRQSDMVGGFDVFKALERSQQEVAKRRVSSGNQSRPGSVPSADAGPTPKKVASHIGHTALPPKHKLVCFECSFNFEISGKIDSIQCPRCRVPISLRDVVIEGNWTEDLKTGGIVEVKPEGVIKDCEVIAKDVVLAGKIEGGTINAYRRLILKPGGQYDAELIDAKSLEIAKGVELEYDDIGLFTDLDVYGSLIARNLTVENLVIVRSSGSLSGKLRARRLAVEEGGGLLATVEISGGSG